VNVPHSLQSYSVKPTLAIHLNMDILMHLFQKKYFPSSASWYYIQRFNLLQVLSIRCCSRHIRTRHPPIRFYDSLTWTIIVGSAADGPGGRSPYTGEGSRQETLHSECASKGFPTNAYLWRCDESMKINIFYCLWNSLGLWIILGLGLLNGKYSFQHDCTINLSLRLRKGLTGS